MSPREFVKAFAKDDRLFNGRFFSPGPLNVASGDHIGIVLLVPGAPESREEVFPYLFRRLMLPEGSVPAWRFLLVKIKSRLRARILSRKVIAEYVSIGGGRAINRLNNEQAVELNRRLSAGQALPDDVRTSTYCASPFGTPSMLDAAGKMQADGVTHVVLLPLFPQYATDTTGRALAHWDALVKNHRIEARPTVAIWEFASHQKYIAALNERIDQALQRFPRHVRSEVALLFAANGTSVESGNDERDPYCCMVHQTVDRVMELRKNDRTISLSFVRKGGFGAQTSIELKEELRALVQAGKKALLVVPVDHVTEQFDTTFLLDVRMRKEAESEGVAHYQVVSGLNCHPLFMEGLVDLVIETIIPSGERNEPGRVDRCPRIHVSGPSVPKKCTLCPYASHHAGVSAAG